MAKLGAEAMMQIERRQFWTAVHRYSGLTMLAFLAVAAATGCLLCFAKPLDAWLNPELFRPSGSALVDPVQAVARLEHDRPDLVAIDFSVHAEPGRNLTVVVEPSPGGPPLGVMQQS